MRHYPALWLCVLVLFLLTGCTPEMSRFSSERTGGFSAAPDSLESGAALREEDAASADERDSVTEAAVSDGFCYQMLNTAQQALYRDLYRAAESRTHSLLVSVDADDDIGISLNAMLNDHPEFFWLDGSASYYGFYGGGLKKIDLTFNIEDSEIDSVQHDIDACAQEYLDSLDADASDYEKAEQAYSYIITLTDYDSDAPMSQNIQSVFLHHRSVCSGYTKAFQYLLNQAGIDSVGYVSGTAAYRDDMEPQNHSWNLVTLDGIQTLVDVTWGDPTYTEGGEEQSDETVSYDYLCLTSEELSRDRHTPDPDVTVPDCTSTEYDYYRLHDEFFDDYSADTLSAYLQSAVENGETEICMKFADAESFEEAENALFTENPGLLYEPLQTWMRQNGASSVHYRYSINDALYIIKIRL